ncbi:hypothetical protein ETB97_006882 [Aspergillus alliaceus]|uniref:GPI inositol-deacylase winged helix domain-containing protein n=1 Tax=Petromyces alliaceus TaxID=209559 RepID=A0A8H6AGM5_PETAA|nr:hypothetical protein ETB97_006882 [Aspergillus burnettii]
MSSLFSLQGKSNTNIFATSRTNHTLSEDFRKEDALSLEIRATDQDILLYLGQQIANRRSNILNSSVWDLITPEVVEKVDGMFLLATRIMDLLANPPNEGYKPTKCQWREFEGKYEKDLAKKILAWLVHANRPLATQELQHALAAQQLDKSELNECYITEVEYLRSICRGLIAVDKESDYHPLFCSQSILDRGSGSALHSQILHRPALHTSHTMYSEAECVVHVNSSNGWVHIAFTTMLRETGGTTPAYLKSMDASVS